MSAKDIRDLLAEYRSHGFRVEHRNNHNKIFTESGQLVAAVPSSTCGGRASQNARATLRRVLRQQAATA